MPFPILPSAGITAGSIALLINNIAARRAKTSKNREKQKSTLSDEMKNLYKQEALNTYSRVASII